MLAFLIGFAILIYSVILHEIAHGWVADRLGDPTARIRGRLTLNPIPHIDPLMTIFLPLILIIPQLPNIRFVFGAAKPVPIDPFNFREGRKDIGLVGLAGPGTNLIIAIIATLLFKIIILLQFSNLTFLYILEFTVRVNLALAALNLIPIPPLDGSRILGAILPKQFLPILDSLESFGLFIIFFLLFFPIGGFSLGDIIFGLVSVWMRFLGF